MSMPPSAMNTMRPQQPISAIVRRVADQPVPALQRLVDEADGGVGERAEIVHDGGIDRAEAAVVADLGDGGDVVGFPGQPFARGPAVLFGGAGEVAGGSARGNPE